MKTSIPGVRNVLLAAAMALPLFTLGAAARADDEMGADPAVGQDQRGPRGPGLNGGPERGAPEHGGPEHGGPGPDHGGSGFGPGPRPGPGFGFGPGRPPFFRGIELSEAQEDKVFAILHAEAPYLREQGKAAVKARQALRELATADKYDDAKAAALAQAAAAAEANIALQHVRTQQKLLAVLTPEQRKQQADDRPGHPPHP